MPNMQRNFGKRLSGCRCTLGWMSYGMAGEVSLKIFMSVIYIFLERLVPWLCGFRKIKRKMQHRLICSEKPLD